MYWLLAIGLVLLIVIIPGLRLKMMEVNRLREMRNLEVKRGSRVITLIHRQESVSLLGLPIVRYINIEDSEELLRAIKLTDRNMPIDLILHTPGGLVLASEQIARALTRHTAKVTVFVPHYAMSGGTLLALAADEIVMDENAVLGPVDPQLGDRPAASILKVLEQKEINAISDETLILADMSRKAIGQVRNTVQRLILQNQRKDADPQQAERLADLLATGTWTHDYPIMLEEARALGLNVSTEMPEEVYKLMSLYAQAATQRPSVTYVPLKYTKPAETKPSVS